LNAAPNWVLPLQVDGDEPKNWKACNRPLSPAELMYAFAAHKIKDDDEPRESANLRGVRKSYA
jgi:hypothetical protein